MLNFDVWEVVSQVGWEVGELTFGGNFCLSKKSRSARSSYISVFWCGADGDIQEFKRMYHLLCPGRVKYFLKHSVSNEQFKHVLACVEWYLPVDEKTRFTYGKPVEIWKNHLFEVRRSAFFMLVQRIKDKFGIIETKVENRDVVVVLPRDRYLHV